MMTLLRKARHPIGYLAEATRPKIRLHSKVGDLAGLEGTTWRDVVCRRTAHPRNRIAHGSRRQPAASASVGVGGRDAARVDRARGRVGWHLLCWPADGDHLVSSECAGSRSYSHATSPRAARPKWIPWWLCATNELRLKYVQGLLTAGASTELADHPLAPAEHLLELTSC